MIQNRGYLVELKYSPTRKGKSALFEALQIARNEASKVGLTLLCNGARLNVYPSPMMRSMGGAAMAYTLTLGEQAQRKNIVCIFDNTEEPISTPKEQDEFYQRWLKSL